MTERNENRLLLKAKQLRRSMTEQERKLWHLFLKSYPEKIYRQRIIGPYIADFYCHTARLVIEIDGTQHYMEEGKAYDARRSAAFLEWGIEVIRFSNREIEREFKAVCEAIHKEIQRRIRDKKV